MSTPATSIASFIEGTVSGSFQNQADELFHLVSAHPLYTNSEYWENWLKATRPYTSRQQTPARMTDLRIAGRVRVAGSRTCNVTGKEAAIWEVVPIALQTQYQITAMQEKLLGMEQDMHAKHQAIGNLAAKLAALVAGTPQG